MFADICVWCRIMIVRRLFGELILILITLIEGGAFLWLFFSSIEDMLCSFDIWPTLTLLQTTTILLLSQWLRTPRFILDV